MRRSTTLPLILLGAGAIACVAAGYSLWRRTFPPRSTSMPVAVVTGSSMVETLHGPTVRGTCETCGSPLRFAIESLPSAGDVLCPNCGAPIEIEGLTPAEADRIAIRPLEPGESPKIGGLYVFAAPEGEGEPPVAKRIVAAPGQRVSIEEGDLFVDGVRVQKDPLDESSPRILVHAEPPGAKRSGKSTIWGARPAPDERLAYIFAPRTVWAPERRPTPVLDSYPSQAVERRLLNPVPDIWMCGELAANEAVAAQFTFYASNRYTLAVETDGTWALAREDFYGPVELVSGRLPDWSKLETFRFGMLDRQIFLVRPARASVVVPIDEETKSYPRHSPLGIELPEGTDLSELRVERDVHYLPPTGAEEPWEETQESAGDGWFALGDYPSYSIDSRQIGRFPSESILGEALLPPIAEGEAE